MRLLPVLLVALSPLLAQDPVDARGWLNRGVGEFKSAHYPEAVAAFQRAVENDPAWVTARLYLATGYMQQWIPGSDVPENEALAASAEREFRKVIEMDPANSTATSYMASLYLNQKKLDAAQEWYEKLAAMDPHNAVAWYSMAFIDWSRWYPAISEARVKSGMKLDQPGPLPAGAIKADLKARYDAVIEHGLKSLRRALEIDPKYDDAMAYINLFIRERADLLDSSEEYRREIEVANAWVEKAIAVKKEKMEQFQKK